ncbi:MAG: hypothetical protein HUU57_04655 [Bdellovibrio sp.]|nr:hypothetical protein [Bdellovibrio sp.]
MKLVKLSNAHKDQILEFWDSKRDLYGQTLEADPSRNRAKYEHIFESDSKDRYSIYAAFDDDGKISFTLGSVLWDGLPYYSIIDFFTRPTKRAENQVMKFMAAAITQILQERLQQKRHTFYYVFKRDHVNRDVEWSSDFNHSYQRFMPETQKYSYSTEAIVLAGEKPQYSSYWKLLGERTHNVELVIRKAILKPEYMKEIFSR